MGQIWDFLRSVSVHFGAPRQNVLKLILKSPRFVPFGPNLDAKFDTLRVSDQLMDLARELVSCARTRYMNHVTRTARLVHSCHFYYFHLKPNSPEMPSATTFYHTRFSDQLKWVVSLARQ